MYFVLGLMTSDNLKSKIECLEKQKSRLSVMTSQELSEITGLTLHKHPAYSIDYLEMLFIILLETMW